MSSSRSSRSSHSGSTRSSGSRSTTSSRPSQQSLTLLTHLQTNPPTTLSALLHLERTITDPSQIPSSDVSLFQSPMTSAFENYVVTTQSLLVELRGLTTNYPFSAQIIPLAVQFVRADPDSDRSWNLAWLVLNKILSEGLVESVSWEEAGWEGYWGNRLPSEAERGMLAGEMAREWKEAVERLVGVTGFGSVSGAGSGEVGTEPNPDPDPEVVWGWTGAGRAGSVVDIRQ
ncbi:hypothetical protein B0T09DRAFT_402252 [Sordaria sp. MPI-SDFR-AT-0083]|nr:hypothetical protein B0T09DRAFT_402252 [Sordaria sp. MPI-SDFR-AT-0083]